MNRLLIRAPLVAIAVVSGSCSSGHTASSPSSLAASSAPTTGQRALPPTRTTPAPNVIHPAGGPPYPIREVTLKILDPTRPTVSRGRTVSRSRALTTLVWVPQGDRRWPVVVFAHGFRVGPAPYEGLLESWAEHGYIVAAPEFPLTDPDVAGANLDEYDIQNQPADVRFVTDYLVSPRSPLAGLVEPSRVAVAGHSDGAETALAAGTDPVPSGTPAYRAILVFGAQPVTGAAGRNPPMLVGQGDLDQINPPSRGYDTFHQAAPPKYLLVFKGGGHLAPLETGSTWLAGLEAVSETFLDAYVAQDARPPAVGSVGPQYPHLSVVVG